MIPLSIPCKKVKIANYHLRQLFWPVSQISIQRNMLGFHVEGHILFDYTVSGFIQDFRLGGKTCQYSNKSRLGGSGGMLPQNNF